MPESVRVAVIDIGSNSTRLLVAEVAGGRVRTELERHSKVTRLGAGVDASGRLREEAMERVYAVLADYERLMERHAAERRIAVLTSAVRDAANGERFADAVGKRFGLEPYVLSGDEEARLTFLGATGERDPADRVPTLVIDIGGGSTELVIGAGQSDSFHASTQAGVVRQAERHIHSDPPTPQQLNALRADVDQILAQAVPAEYRCQVQRGIGVAGTATSLAAIAQELEPYDSARTQGYVIGAAERDRVLRTLVPMPLTRRRLVPGLHPDRAPVIIPGVLILTAVMELFGLEEIEVSEHDILRGAAVGL